MIGVSGRRQSLYTSRPWDLTLYHQVDMVTHDYGVHVACKRINTLIKHTPNICPDKAVSLIEHISISINLSSSNGEVSNGFTSQTIQLISCQYYYVNSNWLIILFPIKAHHCSISTLGHLYCSIPYCGIQVDAVLLLKTRHHTALPGLITHP